MAVRDRSRSEHLTVPVSSPSYFPPNSTSDQIIGINAGKLATGARTFLAGKSAGNNSTVPDLIVIGDLAASAGITDANAQYSVIIGSNSATAWLNPTGTISPGPTIVIGGNSVPLATHMLANLIIVGAGVLSSYGPISPSQTGNNIFIGHKILSGMNNSTGFLQLFNNVIIGNGACISNANNNTFSSNTIIGAGAAADLSNNNSGGAVSNTIIGAGAGAVLGNSGTSAQQNTIIGAGAAGVVMAVASQNIVIGYNAGIAGLNNTSGKCVIEVNNISGWVYADMLAGNVILGNSTPGVSGPRDFGGVPGTNMLKLLNGTKATGANIIGGGYFYVLAGDLHWVDSAGLDTVLSGNVNLPAPAAGATLTTAGNIVFNAPTAGDTLTVAPSVTTGALIATNAALANNAGAQVATILNGPLAGNPTKWVPINDNGTIRNIPAW